MNGFLLAIAVLSFLVLFQPVMLYGSEKHSDFIQGLEGLYSAEKASLQRKAVEENIHFLIKAELSSLLESGSIDSKAAKERIALKLNDFFGRFSLKERPSLQELNDSFKVLVIVIGDSVIAAKFFNAGRQLRLSFDSAGITQFVLIPKNYSVEVISLA